jgi:predicted Fe-Mo cluster-binding NifX family protein
MLVAFGMDDEKHLTAGHYGDSKFFLIYRIKDGKAELVEKRENRAADMEEAEHGDVRKFRAVLSQLDDVDVLAAFRMGPNFVRIRDSTDKKVIFTRTRELDKALEVVLKKIEEEQAIS